MQIYFTVPLRVAVAAARRRGGTKGQHEKSNPTHVTISYPHASVQFS